MTERVLRITGALALLGSGVVHLQQFASESYSAIPTIGTLFILNFAAATAVALGLLVPVQRPAARRLLALGGVGLAVGSLAALFMAENGGVFGFTEHGYRFAIVLAIAFEVVAAVCLGAFTALGAPARASGRAPARPTPQRGA
jgi:hypothetical protein